LCSPIDVFVTYDGKRAADISVSRYAVRQLVATEVCESVEYEITILTLPKIDAALVAKQADAVEKGKEDARANFFKTFVYLHIWCLRHSHGRYVDRGRATQKISTNLVSPWKPQKTRKNYAAWIRLQSLALKTNEHAYWRQWTLQTRSG